MRVTEVAMTTSADGTYPAIDVGEMAVMTADCFKNFV